MFTFITANKKISKQKYREQFRKLFSAALIIEIYATYKTHMDREIPAAIPAIEAPNPSQPAVFSPTPN